MIPASCAGHGGDEGLGSEVVDGAGQAAERLAS
jgi:hypothetical protein